MVKLGRPQLERLMFYHRFLFEIMSSNHTSTVTSAQISKALELDPTQVRKDMAALGVRGSPRVGFEIVEVYEQIRRRLGFNRQHKAILVGVGHLGQALLTYPGFARYGLRIVAAFDQDPRKVGTRIAGLRIKSIRSIRHYLAENRMSLAVLTVPADVAQMITCQLVEAGIRTFWNFAPTRLAVPSSVFVREEHISLGLSELAYHLAVSKQ